MFGVESKLVKMGDSVTLNSDLTEIKGDDRILWSFGNENTLIAEINKRNRMTVYDDVLDGRFRDRLKLDKQTGSLTITNMRMKHAGLFTLESKNTRKSFYVNILGELN